jgi:hypothetical protein
MDQVENGGSREWEYTLMMHSRLAARDALEKMSSTVKTAFPASNFYSDSMLALSSPRLPITELHRSPCLHPPVAI